MEINGTVIHSNSIYNFLNYNYNYNSGFSVRASVV
jgi:hypothetical protein